MKVKQLENKNQFVIYGENEIVFQIYKSEIAVYNKLYETLKLGRNWDYSKTTLKHLYIFIDEELPNCYNLKQLHETKYSKNRKKSIQQLIDNGVIEYDEELI